MSTIERVLRRSTMTITCGLTISGGSALFGPMLAVAAVPGLTTVKVTSVSDSASVKSIIATCPAGTSVIGGGYQLGGTLSRAEVHVPELRPLGNGIEAVAYEDDNGFASNWTLQAIAVCADPLPGLITVTAASASNSTTPKYALVGCPANTQLVGTAASVGGGGGEVVLNRVQPTATSLMVTAYEDGTGTTNSWNVQAHAFCATPPAGLQIVSGSSGTTSIGKGLTVTCPAGKGVLGGGVFVSQNTGEVGIDDINLGSYAGSDYVIVAANEDGNGYSGFWRLDGYAICATR